MPFALSIGAPLFDGDEVAAELVAGIAFSDDARLHDDVRMPARPSPTVGKTHGNTRLRCRDIVFRCKS